IPTNDGNPTTSLLGPSATTNFATHCDDGPQTQAPGCHVVLVVATLLNHGEANCVPKLHSHPTMHHVPQHDDCTCLPTLPSRHSLTDDLHVQLHDPFSHVSLAHRPQTSANRQNTHPTHGTSVVDANDPSQPEYEPHVHGPLPPLDVLHNIPTNDGNPTTALLGPSATTNFATHDAAQKLLSLPTD
ncbi:MAG: hypothetical protein ACK56I_13365, partial [bacterium]